MSKKYWWKDSGIIGEGYYFLCHNENADYDCYIVDTTLASLIRTNKELLGNARFAWGKYEGGLGYNLKPLRALTLENAKAELEEIYYQMLADKIAALNKAKEQAIDEKGSFFLYLEKKGHPITSQEFG